MPLSPLEAEARRYAAARRAIHIAAGLWPSGAPLDKLGMLEVAMEHDMVWEYNVVLRYYFRALLGNDVVQTRRQILRFARNRIAARRQESSSIHGLCDCHDFSKIVEQ